MPVGTIGCRTAFVRDSLGNVKPALQVSLMYNRFRSYLTFTDGTTPVLSQQTAGAEVAWHFMSRRSFGIGAGVVLGGEFSFRDTSLTLKYGPVVSIRYSRILMTEYFPVPFIVAGVSGAFSRMPTEKTGAAAHSFIASDVRLSLTAGYTIRERLQIYLAPKLFGGPIVHITDGEAVRGRDRTFFQTGMGLTLILPREYMLFVNGSPLGEQSIGGGISKIF